jgi:hypothetical protein
MQPSTSRLTCVVLLLVLTVTGSSAQELAGSFDQLRVLVRTGDRVTVTDAGGRELQGTIAELSRSALALTVDGSRHVFAEPDITAIRQRRPDSLANGAKWGFIVGAGLGLLAGLTLASEYDGNGSALIPVLALAYGGIGAGTGAGIDALHSGQQVIFAARARASW